MAIAWLALAGYGVALFLVAPRARTHRGFFWAEGERDDGPSTALGTGSVLVSGIFAKSITNAANLGERYGPLGGRAYAAWYLSIPVAGGIIHRIRRAGHEGLIPFLADRFGSAAATHFSATILIRLYNEVWSNTAVVGGYFGPPGSPAYYLAAFAFTACMLAYTLRGGLRSSIFTDRLQLALPLGLLAWVLGRIVPAHGPTAMLRTGVELCASRGWLAPHPCGTAAPGCARTSFRFRIRRRILLSTRTCRRGPPWRALR